MEKMAPWAFVAAVLLLPLNPVRAGERLSMGTGGTAGVYYPLGGAMAQLAADRADVSLSPQSTGASGENLRLTETRELDMSIVQNDLAHAAYNGLSPFIEPLENLRAIARLYPEYLHVVASEESGIRSVADFRGKRISVGARGSGNEANCRQIFGFYDLDYDAMQPVFLPYGETADMFKEKQIDAFVFTIGSPNPAVQDLASAQNIRFVPVDGAVRDYIVKEYPYFARDQLPGYSYKGQTEPVETLSVQAMLIAHKDVPDDTVYAVTKAIFDNLDELRAAHHKAAEFDLKKALDGVTIPLHPGAERYLREKGIVK